MEDWKERLDKQIVEGENRTFEGKELKMSHKLALEGRLLFTFAWPAEEFAAFIDAFCDEDKKPNEAVWELITEALERKSGNLDNTEA